MLNFNLKSVSPVLACVGILGLASCTSEKKTEAQGDGVTSISVVSGEAGGVIEESFTTSATVNGVNSSTRVINFTTADGTKTSFKAGPEIRNFDQIRTGDKVNATVVQRLTVFVRRDGEDPALTHAAALATAPKGAKPGVMIGESYEITAKVTSIDTANRKATIQFIDGQTKSVTPRADVDLTRYKVGDTVVIRVTAALAVLVETP